VAGASRLAVLFLALADLAVFADVLSPWGESVPAGGDVEVHGRLYEFAARHLARGELPLWNPHLFSGTPALGNPNAMMLYPPTLLSVVLPLPAAITLSTVLHTFLAGIFTYLWTARRGLHPLGGVLAASMVSLGGPFFARIYAGHLSVLAAMAWSPLVLLAADEIVRAPSARWVAVGALALAMQILGGHPQYVFCSLLAAGLSVLLQLPAASRRTRTLGAFASMLVWGAALAAVAIVPLADALRQDVRAGSLRFGEASEFSLTWSALLMLLVPHFYGQGTWTDYWGDWLYWEMTPFVGIVGLAAAVYGALRGDGRRRRFAGLLAIAFLVLALGSNTPLFGLLYRWVPPFDRMRSSARSLFHFGLFTAMLAAVGVDALLRDRRPCRPLVAALLAAALGLTALAGWIWTAVSGPAGPTRADIEAVLRLPAEQREARIGEMAHGDATRAERLRRAARAWDLVVRAPDPAARDRASQEYASQYVGAMSVDRWQDLRAWLVGTKGYSRALQDWADPAAARREAHAAIPRLLVAAVVCAAAALMLRRAPWATNAVVGLVCIGIAEMLGYAWSSRTSFDLRHFHRASLAAFFQAHPGDYRVHDQTVPNSAISVGSQDIWGYDPFVSARYADYMASTQGPDRRSGASFVHIDRPHRSFAMLRLQYVLAEEDDRVRVVAGPAQMAPPLPRVGLMRRYEVHAGRDAVLAALDSPGWDPARTVILESEPRPAPDPAGDGTVTIRDESTDHLTIEADLDAPAILLVTDAYSEGWRATPVDADGPQQRYEVLPANYVLRAVPLAAGRHRIRMEFVPAYFRVGLTASLGALAALMIVGGSALSGRRARRPARPDAPP
jgi:hypothetical protein